jgi:LacI family transcriptional regulator
MNGAQNVDAKLGRKVWKAVAEIGYVPNRHAQALISGRTRLLGLVVSEIVNPFFPELIQGFEKAAMAEGFSVLIGTTNANPSLTGEWVQRMLQHGIEGLALLTFTSEPTAVFDLLKNTPTVQIGIGGENAGAGAEIVEVDYDTGLRQAVQHLAVLGHRDIVFAAGSPDDPTAALRERCFRTFLREIGVTVQDAVFREHHTLEGGIAAARRILARKTLPTALICSNDLMAIGALKVFHAEALRVPQDISVIGLDDIHLAEFLSPPLTTVRIPRMQLAQNCFDVLLQKLRPQAGNGTQHPVVATDLVVRESTGYPRQATQPASKRKRP